MSVLALALVVLLAFALALWIVTVVVTYWRLRDARERYAFECATCGAEYAARQPGCPVCGAQRSRVDVEMPNEELVELLTELSEEDLDDLRDSSDE